MSLQKGLLATAIAIALPAAAGHAAEEDQSTLVLPAMEVSGEGYTATTEGTDSYATRVTSTATRLQMSPRETPQSVTVVTRTLMDDFGLTSFKDALEVATGLTVERVETDRSYLTSRGFDITNFQFDGIAGAPAPFDNVIGEIDTAIYDRIEVVRGATGLMTGAGNPAAAVNFVRKRPTRDTRAAVSLTGGSWERGRADVDLSGPITGRLRGRTVLVYEDGDSYLDRYASRKSVFYGVLEADLSEDTLLTLGHSVQNTDVNSPLWGSLPLHYADGRATDYDASTSTAADWAHWDAEDTSSFVELARRLTGGWEAKAVVTRREYSDDAKLFYVYGIPDPATPGSDLYAYPARYGSEYEHLIADLYATGPFMLAGRRHELVLGASWARLQIDDVTHYGRGIGTELPGADLDAWDGDYPEPAFDAGVRGSDWEDEYTSAYAAARLSLGERLSGVLGARLTRVDSEGVSYDVSKETSAEALTPYAGLVYDLSETYSLYASYAQIFNPQTEVDVNGDRLDPVEGVSYEAGIKGEWHDGRLYGALAVFRSLQDNVAEPDGPVGSGYYKAGEGDEAQGFEVELAGRLSPGLQVAAGYTHVRIEDADGRKSRTYLPRNTLRLAARYRPVWQQRLRLGASLKWQDETYAIHEGVRIEQDSRAVLDLMAGYEITPRLSARLNLNNVTDEKYYTSLYWAESNGQGYYAEPRSTSLTLSWRY